MNHSHIAFTALTAAMLAAPALPMHADGKDQLPTTAFTNLHVDSCTVQPQQSAPKKERPIENQETPHYRRLR